MVEILMATGLMAVVLAPLLGALSTGTRAAGDSERVLMLALRARRHQAALLLLPHDELIARRGQAQPPPAADAELEAAERPHLPADLAEVTLVESPEDGLLELITRVSWTDAKNGQRRSMEVRRLVARSTTTLSAREPLEVATP
jgi:hypothetical protein